ncbi:carbohydrate esterase family 9 protein [Daedalea quercina L-15889]|uniref:Carbohydrate esterase family 9 protein n=1 Tax=Daedalea quercina L-15889 TaxID=1314783 RepID=A0A165N5P2_9APHY|nr:carbohydrate esterase family 9 protein [Daedalea quercina L-15889]
MDKQRVSKTRGVTVQFLAGLLTLSALVSIFQSHASFTASERVKHVQIPLNAEDILGRCAALGVTPSPPANFYERTQSDRFEPGTKPLLIRNATLWTGRQDVLDAVAGDLYLDQGIIQAVGQVSVETLGRDVTVIDANGAWVTPGIIDVHSHLAVEPLPALEGAMDGNSLRGIAQPWLRSIDALNMHDEGYKHSIAGGITTSLILPGSANAIGGQAFVMKLRTTKERSPTSMLVEPPYSLNGSDADPSLPLRWRYMKHACGENPSRVYAGTRMDTAWAFRSAYGRARQIKVAQDDYCAKATAGEWNALSGQTFPEDLQWEALVDVLRGRVKVNTHCYEAVDFDDFVRLSNEFKFPVAAFHHAHEAYLVPELLKSAYGQTPAIAMFSTFSRYKREAYRHSEYAPRILAEQGIPVIMKSDHPAIQSRFLVNEAGYAHYYGLPENIALASVTSTPAVTLGLDHRIGFLKEGYDADVVIWDSHPLALGAAPAQVIIDGIAQIKPSYPAVKPKSSQRVLHTPKWDKEAKAAVDYDGLPPLGPAQSTKGVVVFTNVSSNWVKDRESSDLADLFASTEGPGAVVVRGGRVVCSSTLYDQCAPYIAANAENVHVDLRGGSLQPGLITTGSSIGLQEIAMEMSTTDGVAFDPLAADVPSIAGGVGYMPRAVDGLQFGSRDAMLAYRHGVTLAVSAPIHSSFLGGLSAAFSLGSMHKLEEGAVVQDIAALHVKLAPQGAPSVSTQVATLRHLLLNPVGEIGPYFQLVTNGTLPLVVEADSADIIATVIQLKRDVESEMGVLLRVTISGGGESHVLAKELGEASVGVILKPPRPYPLQWDHRRYLPGPPASADSTIATLLRHSVTVALGPQGVTNEDSMYTWAVRNLRFDAAWAHLEAPDVVDKASAAALVSSNAAKLLGLNIPSGDEDLVATVGGDLLSFEGKVMAVISPRRGTVDIF